MMGNGHRRTQLLVEDLFASCNHCGKKKSFQDKHPCNNYKRWKLWEESFFVSKSYDTVIMGKQKFMDAWLIKLVRSGSFGCSEILTQFVREIFLKALFFGVRSFGHIFSSDQLWYSPTESTRYFHRFVRLQKAVTNQDKGRESKNVLMADLSFVAKFLSIRI